MLEKLKIWKDFPALCIGGGSLEKGSACIMNLISYQNGDQIITDMPECTYPAISKLMQALNDNICMHSTEISKDGRALLCSDCVSVVLGYEPLIVSTPVPKDYDLAMKLAFNIERALQLKATEPREVPWQVGVDGYVDDSRHRRAFYVESVRVVSWNGKHKIAVEQLQEIINVVIDTYFDTLGLDKKEITIEDIAEFRKVANAYFAKEPVPVNA